MDYSVLYPLIIAVITLLAGGGGVVAILRKSEKDREFRRATEDTLAALVPSAIVGEMNRLAHLAVEAAQYAQRAAQFVADATDGKSDEPVVVNVANIKEQVAKVFESASRDLE